MKERPILFSAPMVRAILEGRKTQTRRAVKLKPWHGVEEREDCTFWPWMHDSERAADCWLNCPYGSPGDLLWVRETWCVNPRRHFGVEPSGPEHCLYRATAAKIDSGFKWTPSIHMPRWASRITLKITDVRVERLQAISTDGIRAEGITIPATDCFPDVNTGSKLRDQWQRLWTDINGADSWAANPWVWVVSFERVK